jgi:hypothetical protein
MTLSISSIITSDISSFPVSMPTVSDTWPLALEEIHLHPLSCNDSLIVAFFVAYYEIFP